MRKNIVKVRLVLISEGRVLMLKQRNDRKGKHTLPGGKVEKHESIKNALVRECFEEVGILLDEKKLEVIHVLHKYRVKEHRVTFYFSAKEWTGEIECRELDKFSLVEWCDLDRLPVTTSGTVSHVMNEINNNRLCSNLVIRSRTAKKKAKGASILSSRI